METKFFKLFSGLPDSIDGFIISNSKLLHYYIGLSSLEGLLFVTRSQVFLLVDFRYFEIARTYAKNCEVVLFESLRKKFDEILKQSGCKTIAVASSGVNVKTFFNYKTWFSDVNFVLSNELDDGIALQMAVKTQDEIEKIASAQKVAEKVFSQILNVIRPEITELEVAREINSLIFKQAQATSFETIVVSGTRTSLPHGHATNKPIKKGELVTLDFGAVVEGYCSDMTRTICVGSVSNFQKEIYELVRVGQAMAIEKIKSGVSCSEVDLLVRNHFKVYGYEKEFGHSLGHGVGLNIHELPNVSSKSSLNFEQNMVVTVEPGLYFEGRFGVRIEDMVVVKDDGVLNLTGCSKKLICL